MFTIYLNEKIKKPFYEQIYEYIREEIKAGHLKANEKLPSSRKLAQHLNVSRSTVDNAYAQLIAEGYIDSKAKRGYFVCEIGEMYQMIPISYPFSIKETPKTHSCKWDFSPVGADGLNFPDAYWRKLSKLCINYDDGTLFKSSEPQGDTAFREELCNYLRQNRGVVCSPNQIVIGAGSQYLMMLLLQLLPGNGGIGMENPSYMQSYYTFQSMNREVVPISVDEHGMVVKELEQTDVSVAYVTPSHQFPLGVVMPANRRMALLNWAGYEPGRYIIEDDYDSEFRYQGKPIPALQSMDKGKKVIYMGSFSKVMSPAIRLSYMVLPDVLLDRYQKLFSTFPCTVSRMDQAIVTMFLKDGYFERHLNRLRNRYKNRHDRMLKELKKWGDFVRLSGTNAGSYIVMEWMGNLEEEQLIDLARQQEIQLYPLSQFTISPCLFIHPTFLMGFAQMDEEEMQEVFAKLRKIFK